MLAIPTFTYAMWEKIQTYREYLPRVVTIDSIYSHDQDWSTPQLTCLAPVALRTCGVNRSLGSQYRLSHHKGRWEPGFNVLAV